MHHIDHEDAIAAVTQTWREIQAFVLTVVDDLRLGTPVDVVVEKDALFEKDVHLIVLITLAAAAWLLVDVQIEHLLEVAKVDLVITNWLLSLFLWQKVSIGCLEAINYDLVALHVDSTKDTIVGHTHHNHLILIVSTALLL